MGPDQGGVEHDVLVIRILDEGCKDALPDAPVGPSAEALVDALPLAVALGKVVPVRTGAQHPETGVHKQPVVLSCAPRVALFARQKRRDPPPLRIAQLIPLRHPTSSRIDSGNS
jgi:hypothetical protein